jgi:WD40 repeat protein
MKSLPVFNGLLAAAFLGACTAPTPLPTSTPVATQAVALPPTQAATLPPTQAASPTPTPDTELQPVSSSNVAQLKPLRSVGEARVATLAWSPDGSELAAARSLGIYLYDPETWEPRQFIDTGMSIDTVTFSPDGKLLAGLSETGGGMWDKTTGQFLYSVFGTSIVFSPDGRMYATGNREGAGLRLWQTSNGHLLQDLEVSPDFMGTDPLRFPSRPLGFTPDRRTLISGNQFSVKTWDTASGELLQTLEVDKPHSLAVSPDGRLLALGSQGMKNTVTLVDIASGQLLHTLEEEHEWITHLAFSADGRRLAAASAHMLTEWDTTTGEVLLSLLPLDLQWNHMGLAFSPDGRSLKIEDPDRAMFIDRTSDQARFFDKHPQVVTAIAFSPNGATLATAGYHAIQRWDVETLWRTHDSPPISTWSIYPDEYEQHGQLQSHLVTRLAFSPDGGRLAFGSLGWPEFGAVWDTTLGKMIQQLEAYSDGTNLIFSPDGRWLAIMGYYKRNVIFYDQVSGESWTTPEEPWSSVIGAAFGPDGLTCVVVKQDSTVEIWDPYTRQRLQTWKADNTQIARMALSPDGRTLALGPRYFPNLQLWEVDGTRLLYTLEAESPYEDKPTSMAFSPDGRLLAWGADNGTLKFWDAGTGQLLHTTLEGHTGSVFDIRFSPDASLVASLSADGTTRVWGVAY